MKRPVDVIKYRGKKIKVYVDFDGQSYYFKYKGKEYNCGTFNTDYRCEIISVVDADLDEVFYVKPIAKHRPSAIVYKRYGIWYYDYSTFTNLLLSYGDLLKKNERPSKEQLIEKVHSMMSTIDKVENVSDSKE